LLTESKAERQSERPERVWSVPRFTVQCYVPPPGEKYSFTTGPLDGIPQLVVLPHELLRVHGLQVLEDPLFQRGITTLEVLAAGRPLVENDGADTIEPEILGRMNEQDVDYFLRDEQPADSERQKAAQQELKRVRRMLRRSPARSYRNIRAALYEERLRAKNVPAEARRRAIAEKLKMSPTAVKMAVSRGRDALRLPPRSYQRSNTPDR
jgi:hypothetical protein